jgi:broad specificity phosphatase PhoE
MVRITYFVHGTTVDNQNEISSGWSDAPLSDLGREQSIALGAQTADMKFDVVFCSDLQRAKESAALAWGDTYPIIPDARLRECNYGDMNGHASHIVEPLQEKQMHHTPFPHGESYDDVKIRVKDFLSFLDKNYDGKYVAIVGHKAPQLSLDVLLNHMTWDEALARDWRKTKAWQPGWEYVLP